MKNFFKTSTGIWNLPNALEYNYDGRIFVRFVKFDHLEYRLRSIKYESIEFMRKPESLTKLCRTNFNVMANGMKDLNCIPFQILHSCHFTFLECCVNNIIIIIQSKLAQKNWFKFSFQYSPYLFWRFLSFFSPSNNNNLLIIYSNGQIMDDIEKYLFVDQNWLIFNVLCFFSVCIQFHRIHYHKLMCDII